MRVDGKSEGGPGHMTAGARLRPIVQAAPGLPRPAIMMLRESQVVYVALPEFVPRLSTPGGID